MADFFSQRCRALLQIIERLLDVDAVGPTEATLEAAESDRQARDLLAHAVVQFASNPRPLGLLGRDQTAGEVSDPLVARTKNTLIRQNDCLGSTTSGSLREKRCDHQRLEREQGYSPHYERFVAVPGARFLVEHDGPTRKSRFAESPAAKLAPIGSPNNRLAFTNGNSPRRTMAQLLHGQLSDLSRHDVGVEKTSPHDSVLEVVGNDAVDRRIG